MKWMNEWMDGWMDGWMNEWNTHMQETQINTSTFYVVWGAVAAAGFLGLWMPIVRSCDTVDLPVWIGGVDGAYMFSECFVCCGLVFRFCCFLFWFSAPRWSDDWYPSSIEELPLFKSPTVWIYPLRKLLRQIHRQRLKAIPRVEIEAVLVVQKRQEQRDMPSVPTRTAEGKTTELVEPVAQGPHARADAARLR